MRVREAGDSRGQSLEGARRKRGARAVAAGEAPEFARTLEVARVEQVHQTLDELLADLDRAAEELKDHRTLAALRRYRGLVQAFLDTVLHQAYEVQQQTGLDHRGRRVYFLVRRVNEALEELARLTLSRHADPLALLEKLGEIRGLLVDLYT